MSQESYGGRGLRIFISYRRDESVDAARELHRRLSAHLSQSQVFWDISEIDPGLDFVEVIDRAVGSCDVLIALIGRRWLSLEDEAGERRLNDPHDFVRLEIATALERNIRVIPVLLHNASMPREADLPEPLRALSRRNAIDVSASRWDYDVGRLIEWLEKIEPPPLEPRLGQAPAEPDSTAAVDALMETSPPPAEAEPVPGLSPGAMQGADEPAHGPGVPADEAPKEVADEPTTRFAGGISPPSPPQTPTSGALEETASTPRASPRATKPPVALPVQSRAKPRRAPSWLIVGLAGLAVVVATAAWVGLHTGDGTPQSDGPSTPTPLVVGAPSVAPLAVPAPSAPSSPSSGLSAVVEWGTKGSGPGQFSGPEGIAVDGEGTIFVADPGNGRIQKLSPSGQPEAQWGARGSGPGQFNGPVGIAVDGQGNVFVADYVNDCIQKLSPSGQPLAQWGATGSGPGQFSGPEGIAVDGEGNVFVADTGNDRIQKLSPNGQSLAQWGATGSGPGQFDEPEGVAVDAQGNVFVADWGNDRIQKLSPSGQPLAQWGATGSGPGQFDGPDGIAVDRGGNVFVAEEINDRIQKLSPSGQPLAQWGTTGSGPGQFDRPEGIAVDGGGNIFVADNDNDRIQKLAPSGSS